MMFALQGIQCSEIGKQQTSISSIVPDLAEIVFAIRCPDDFYATGIVVK